MVDTVKISELALVDYETLEGTDRLEVSRMSAGPASAGVTVNDLRGGYADLNDTSGEVPHSEVGDLKYTQTAEEAFADKHVPADGGVIFSSGSSGAFSAFESVVGVDQVIAKKPGLAQFNNAQVSINEYQWGCTSSPTRTVFFGRNQYVQYSDDLVTTTRSNFPSGTFSHGTSYVTCTYVGGNFNFFWAATRTATSLQSNQDFLSSPDAVTWTNISQSSIFPSGYSSLSRASSTPAVSGDGSVMVVPNSGRLFNSSAATLAYTTDGVNFTEVSILRDSGGLTVSCEGVVWVPWLNLFVGVGSTSTGTDVSYVFTSSDGQIWSQATPIGQISGGKSLIPWVIIIASEKDRKIFVSNGAGGLFSSDASTFFSLPDYSQGPVGFGASPNYGASISADGVIFAGVSNSPYSSEGVGAFCRRAFDQSSAQSGAGGAGSGVAHDGSCFVFRNPSGYGTLSYSPLVSDGSSSYDRSFGTYCPRVEFQGIAKPYWRALP